MRFAKRIASCAFAGLVLVSITVNMPLEKAVARVEAVQQDLFFTVWSEYEQCCAKIPPELGGKAKYQRKAEILVSILREKLVEIGPEIVVSEFVRADEGAERPKYLTKIGADLIPLLAMDGHRDALTDLLAHNCPTRTDFMSIELTLVVHRNESMPNPILILCDAFAKAENELNRKRIVDSLRRSFRRHVVFAKNAPEFVAACRSWYDDHKDDIVLNDDYDMGNIENQPLFLIRMRENE